MLFSKGLGIHRTDPQRVACLFKDDSQLLGKMGEQRLSVPIIVRVVPCEEPLDKSLVIHIKLLQALRRARRHFTQAGRKHLYTVSCIDWELFEPERFFLILLFCGYPKISLVVPP